MKSRKGCLLGAALVTGLSLLLLCAVAVMLLGRDRSERPTLRVLQPQPNASVAALTPLQVQAIAEGRRQPLRWLRFYVNSLLVGEQMGPGNQLQGAWNWTPTTAGVHTLAFLTVNEGGSQQMVTLQVTVMPTADRDNDSVPDNQDACPDQAAPANQGCPLPNDADNDGLADDQDACPQEAGQPEDGGCLPQNRPDQDGDGIIDGEDHCPALLGFPEWNGCPEEGWLLDSDGDGLVDALDACPLQPGPQDNRGCPLPQASDQDGDGVDDAQEQCPDQPGAVQNAGCPLSDDGDHDGVPDAQDQCPNLPGWPPFNGCLPEGWNTDADNDGVMDFLDGCDNQPGPPWNLGCPSADDQDGDNVPDGQDQCPDREGLPENDGCPNENLPDYSHMIGLERNIFCLALPDLCTFGDIDCNADPQACGLQPGCVNDRDCDGVPDDADQCPDHFGVGIGVVLDGCPLDWNGNGQADEADNDGDGIPIEEDSCPNERGALDNGGCPWPPGENIEVTFELRGFLAEQQYQNFYCYASLQNSGWTRLPKEGSLERSGTTYEVNQQVSLTMSGNQPLQMRVRCEGQVDPLSQVEDLGQIERAFGAEFWHCNWLDTWSDTGGFGAEYRICVE